MKFKFRERRKKYSKLKDNDLFPDITKKKCKLSCGFNITIIFIILLEFFLIIYYYFNLKKINADIKNNNIVIDSVDNTLNLSAIPREESLNLAKQYLNICQSGALINNKTFQDYKNPIFSVVIPVYNSQKSIKRAVRSIQNQNLLNLEIILVNDIPSDNTTKIIEEMQKEDPRIKIIYNQKNMGTLYSRSIGALQARGKYITTIDNDDLFSNRYILSFIFNETENQFFDIISFRAFFFQGTRCGDDFLTSKNDRQHLKHFQPQLGIYAIENRNPIKPNHILIWGKAVRNEVYKSALNLVGKERFSNLIIWAEDTSMYFVISNVADSYKYINVYGIIHFSYSRSSSIVLPSTEKRMGDIYLLDMVIDFSKNEYKKLAAYGLLSSGGVYDRLKSEKVIISLKSLLNKIINCDYIDDNLKNQVRQKFNQFL